VIVDQNIPNMAIGESFSAMQPMGRPNGPFPPQAGGYPLQRYRTNWTKSLKKHRLHLKSLVRRGNKSLSVETAGDDLGVLPGAVAVAFKLGS
jgi:hypothetical protein